MIDKATLKGDRMKTYRIYDANGADVMGGPINGENVYVKTYGLVVVGRKPEDLDVGESCTKEYALSRQKPTRYIITRES